MLPPLVENNPPCCSSAGQYGPTYSGTGAAYGGCHHCEYGCGSIESRIGHAGRHRISVGRASGEDIGK
jgi:hypothetical protein